MSLVSDITTAIETAITAILPPFQKSQYIWDTTKNSESKNRLFFAIRPGSASFVSGTCRTITLEQNFEVEFGDSFKNRLDKDADANDKVMALYEAHETLYREIMRNNFNIGRVQVVANLDISQPEVDNENKVCRIVATYTVRYRTE
jgi:hypothetical protein